MMVSLSPEQVSRFRRIGCRCIKRQCNTKQVEAIKWNRINFRTEMYFNSHYIYLVGMLALITNGIPTMTQMIYLLLPTDDKNVQVSYQLAIMRKYYPPILRLHGNEKRNTQYNWSSYLSLNRTFTVTRRIMAIS